MSFKEMYEEAEACMKKEAEHLKNYHNSGYGVGITVSNVNMVMSGYFSELFKQLYTEFEQINKRLDDIEGKIK